MRFAFYSLMSVGVLLAGPSYSHSLPTHRNITTATVDFLTQSKTLTCNAANRKALTDLLMTGTVGEDDWVDPSNQGKLGRFVFHFLPALSDTAVRAECSSFQWAGLDKPGSRQVNCHYHILPAIRATVGLTIRLPKDFKFFVGRFPLTNGHTYAAAVADARKPHAKHREFGQGFEHLGYVLHLLQDLTSPAHSRNDGHGYLFHGHYSLQPAASGSPDPMEVTARGDETDRKPRLPSPTTRLIDMPPRDLFLALNKYVRQNFFSADTVFQQPGPADLSTAAGRRAAQCLLPGRTCKDGRGRSIAFHDPRRAGPIYKPGLGPGGGGAGEDVGLGNMTVSYAVADAQWEELGPLAVRYGASLIDRYIRDEKPLMPAECRS